MAALVIIGFRPHTYWAATVALAGPLDAPRVLGRRAVLFAAGAERNVYHHAAEVGAERAPALIAAVRMATLAKVQIELELLLGDLARAGARPTIAAVPLSGSRRPQALDQILRSHALMHAAEGHFYRDIVADGCAALGLKVAREVERELSDLLADRLAVTRPALQARLAALGATLGPPWSEDYRLATQAAWLQVR